MNDLAENLYRELEAPGLTGEEKVILIEAAFKEVGREYWDKGYKAHALDLLAGNQVTANPMEDVPTRGTRYPGWTPEREEED